MRTSMHVSFPFPTFGYVPSRTLVGIVVLAARFEHGGVIYQTDQKDFADVIEHSQGRDNLVKSN
jgi:hypothetical protein